MQENDQLIESENNETALDPEMNLLVDIPLDLDNNDEFDEDPLSELEMELDADLGTDFDVIDSYDEDSGEDAEYRKREHIRRKKSDKIFNNTYNTGDGYGNEEHEYQSNIKISPAHRESYLHDPDKYKDYLDQTIINEDILKYIETNKEIKNILTNDPSKKKFTKPEINFIFNKIKISLEKKKNKSSFISYINILEVISNTTTLEYKKLFDLLDYEYKECLLVELNQTYNILDQSNKTKKLF